MSREPKPVVKRGTVIIAGATALAAVMWYSAEVQLTGGLIDIAVFAPPGAALGLMATWAAHAFAPKRFTWRRGLFGALVGGFIVGPLTGFLVAFAAAWNPASFHFVFGAGAWVALAGGLAVGGLLSAVRAVRAWIRARHAARHVTPTTNAVVHTTFEDPRPCTLSESPLRPRY